MLKADLHVHSTASDGTLTPEAVVRAAHDLGLAAVALTDHDTVDGVEQGEEAGRRYGVTVIPGVELSTEMAGNEVHVLGYFISTRAKELRAVLASLRTERLQRARTMVKRLQDLGLSVSWAAVQAQAGGGAVGRPHVARALVAAGYAASVGEAFQRYLERGKPAYIPRAKLTPAQAIALVHQSGGAAVLAHPGLLSSPEALPAVLGLNWQGIEVFYPEHNRQVTEALLALARERGLVATGGSDFHEVKEGRPGLGACTVPQAVVMELKRRRRF